MNKLLTTDELADWLGISEQTVWKWARKGQVPCKRLGRNVLRFDQGEIEAWLAECHEGPVPGTANQS